jgi:hypothetical protein
MTTASPRAHAGRIARTLRGVALPLVLLPLLVAAGPCDGFGFGEPFFRFEAPLHRQLSLLGPVELRLRVPSTLLVPDSVRLAVDGRPVDPGVLSGDIASEDPAFLLGQLEGLAEGRHVVSASALLQVLGLRFRVGALTRFELVDLGSPGDCEILNDVDCLLPYPSSRFLEPAATPTGFRVAFPAAQMPRIVVGTPLQFLSGERSPLNAEVFSDLDGFTPTVHPVMHFPQGVDLAASGAARLLEATRNFDLRSLDPDSPSVLLDLDTGERIPHFLENDDRAPTAERRVTQLRPARSLLPGHRYAVAMRRLRAPDGRAVEPEPPFAVLRDGRPTDIPALEARRAHFEDLFARLGQHGIGRDDLVLAFDFVTQSDQTLTGEMLAMRDEALAWLATQDAASLFTVDQVVDVTPADQCQQGRVWRQVRGRFKAPLYLHRILGGPADPIASPNTMGLLLSDADGPVRSGFSMAPYGIAIPCSAVLSGPQHALLFGHGLFGSGPNTAFDVATGLPELMGALRQAGLLPADVTADYIIGGTNWSGLSHLDIASIPGSVDDFQDLLPVLQSFVGQLFVNFDFFAGLPDRLRQGQLHALLLGRLMKTGVFNVDPAFQWQGEGVFDSEKEMFYYGVSLGGIMGLMHLALSPDLVRGTVDVPAINFPFLLPRAKPFKPLQAFLDAVDPDPLTQALALQLIGELWSQGEPAGYAHHITGSTLPTLSQDTPAKQVLVTVALFDQQVSTLGAQIAAATLGLPNLVGSVNAGLPLLPDEAGPLPGAHVLWDTGSYVPGVHDAFIPPLANRPVAADDNRCDPHGLRALIPASLEQVFRFLRPGGTVQNFCEGSCDAEGPRELPEGLETPCDPL